MNSLLKPWLSLLCAPTWVAGHTGLVWGEGVGWRQKDWRGKAKAERRQVVGGGVGGATVGVGKYISKKF